jgi:hypothetical protein
VKPEAAVQKGIVDLFRQIGCAVYVLSQGYRKEPGGTRQTAGLPDLYCLHPDIPGGALWIECKAERGKPSPAQLAFADECVACGVSYLLAKSVDEAWEYAVAIGLIEEAA